MKEVKYAFNHLNYPKSIIFSKNLTIFMSFLSKNS